VRPAEARAFEHPARTADVLARGVTVGRLFELHPSLIEGRAAILDFDLRLLEAHERRAGQYVPLRRYPSSGFDLTVLAGMRELAGELQDRMAGFAGALLEKIEYVGQYRKSDRKSVTFRFTVGAADRTLSSDEVGAVRLVVIEGMRAAGYELTV
jgi:phenylalanyl-tRNA synthetase beta chain